MTTIISETKTGGRMRRCDANCHNAKGTVCRCVCNGRYHGRGARALEILRADLAAGLHGEALWSAAVASQALLFPMEDRKC